MKELLLSAFFSGCGGSVDGLAGEAFANVELPNPWGSYKGVGDVVCFLNEETNETSAPIRCACTRCQNRYHYD